MAKTAIVRPNPGHTAQMTAKERLGEVATILAAGAVRLQNRATANLELRDAGLLSSQVPFAPDSESLIGRSVHRSTHI